MILDITLDQLNIGESGIITKVGGEGIFRDRLLDMGLTPRTKVYLRKAAPMGDPIELTLRGYELTIRKDSARMIQVRKLHDSDINDSDINDSDINKSEVVESNVNELNCGGNHK